MARIDGHPAPDELEPDAKLFQDLLKGEDILTVGDVLEDGDIGRQTRGRDDS
jgi:hypothetical protein